MPAHLRRVAVDVDLGSACHGAAQDVAVGVDADVVIADRELQGGCGPLALRLCLSASSRCVLRACVAAGSRAAASHRERSGAGEGDQVLHGASVVPLVLCSPTLVTWAGGQARDCRYGPWSRPAGGAFGDLPSRTSPSL